MNNYDERVSVVLLYHRIGLPRPSSLVAGQYVAPQLFQSQLDYLASRGWRCVPLREITEPADGNRFAITFDDAYLSVYEHAYPVMKERGVTAAVFVVADEIGGINEWDRKRGDTLEPMMTAQQLTQMALDGFEIGAHTLTHPHLTDLADDELEREVVESKTRLEHLLGVEVTSFSYPYGDCDDRVIRACRRAGYERAVTTELATVAGHSNLQIPRVNVRWNAVGALLMRKIARARRAAERAR